MKAEKDAYGQEILAHFKGEKSFEIVERDDRYTDLSGGPAAYFAEYKDWPKHQKTAIKFAGGRVLDVGCGAGRVSLYLQKKGLDVTAIDNSPLAIKICKKRGLKKAKIMQITEIGRFKPNSFDTIIMFGNNFGLFGSFKKAKLLLKKFHKLNKKRGRMAGQLRIRIRFREYIGNWLDYLIVSKKEMKEILDGTGWRIKKFIDSGNYMYIAIIEKYEV